MEHSFDFSPALILLLAAVLLVPLFERLRITPILGYLAAGILIGPHALGLIGNVDAVRNIAEFGVIFLLFAIGLDLSFARLYGMRREVFGLGAIQVLMTAMLIGAIGYRSGLSPEASILIGGALAFSSTAMVMQLLAERGETATRVGRIAFSVLLFQDLAVVPMLALVPLLAGEAQGIGTALGIALAKAAAALIVIFLIGRFLLKPLFRVITAHRNRELFVGTTLLIVLGASWATGQLGLSLALGAFLAGLLIAETEYRHQVEGDIAPFRGILLGLFFMTVGMGIDLELVAGNAWVILALLAALLAGKLVLTALLARLFGLPSGLALHVGLLLAQGGEFAFVLFGLGMQLGVLEAPVGQIMIVTVGLSMVVTPLLAILGRRAANTLTPIESVADGGIALAAEDLRRHVVVAGFGRVGQTVSRLLQQHGIPYIAIDLDRDKVEAGRRRGYAVYYGNAAQIDVLRAAGIDRAGLLVMTLDQAHVVSNMVRTLRHHHPGIKILVRGRDREQTADLRAAGATVVIPEALEASLQLSSAALRHSGIAAETVEAALEEIRREDYAPVVSVIAEAPKLPDGKPTP